MFFVLSGFLITTLLLEEWTDTGRLDLKRFYIRRALRLLPALVLVLAAYVSTVALTQGLSSGRGAALYALSALGYVANWVIIARQEWGQMGHLWSLSVEEQFYLLWPLLLWLVLPAIRSPRMIVAATGVLIVASATGQIILYDDASPFRAVAGTDTVAYTVLFGCLLAQLRILELPPLAGLNKRLIGVAAMIGLICYLGFSVTSTSTDPTVRILMTLVLGVVVVGVAEPTNGVSRLLAIRPLRWIGKVSYGLYLWHLLVLEWVSLVVPSASIPVKILLATPLLAVCVAASYILIERPMLNLKERFEPVVDAA